MVVEYLRVRVRREAWTPGGLMGRYASSFNLGLDFGIWMQRRGELSIYWRRTILTELTVTSQVNHDRKVKVVTSVQKLYGSSVTITSILL